MPVKMIPPIRFLLVPILLAIPLAGTAGPAKDAAKPMPKHSVFIMPTNPKEGRDPFFPDSTRVYESNISAAPHVVEINSLAVKGYSIVNGNPIVIINNHSFMVGDEGDVLVPGGRVHVHCIDIKPSLAIVDVNGQRHHLHF
jgi:hypothetical protein